MKPQFILSFLKRGSLILFYLTLFCVVVFTGNFIYKITKDEPSNYLKVIHEDVFIDLNDKSDRSHIYSKDQLIRYKAEKTGFVVEIQPTSFLGYYYILSTVLLIGVILMILWHFHKIFAEINLDVPFKASVVRHLNILAFVFIVADIFGFIHFYILDTLINNSIQNQSIHLTNEIGYDILIGLILLIIAVVYKRGLEIQEENSLTV